MDDIKTMNKNPIVFAMANPVPEIYPDEASKSAFIVASGRSDFPNQINNSLVFPGIFRGALDARITSITDKMKIAAAHALANSIKPSRKKILPSTLDKSVAAKIAKAVIAASKNE